MQGFRKFILRGNAVLSFVVLAAVVYYFVVLPVSKLLEQFSPPPPAPTPACPFCLSKIPVKARRCAFCTSDVEDEVQAVIDQMTGA